MRRRVLVLPSPPTANGDLHLGHLAGPYLGADAFARYRRMCGDEVALVTGADVHQSYVVSAAERLGTTPEGAADRYSDVIERTLKSADVEVDAFVRPHRSGAYKAFVRDFFRRLADQGFVEDLVRPVLWCEACQRYLLGSAVRGLCGECGLDTDGALCEHCSRPVDPAALQVANCARCRGPAVLRPMRRLFFSAGGAVAGALREFHSEVRMRSRPRTVVETLLARGLPGIPVTAPSGWGLEAPAAFTGQRIDVWAEVGGGYLASTQELAVTGRGSDWQSYWCSPAAEIVQFFGFDNTVPHAVVYPAFYLAHGGIRPPSHFVINEFHRLDGEKFSTSRRHAIWAQDMLDRAPSDHLRYYLCLTAPEGEEGNFTVGEFLSTVESELVGTVEPALQAAISAAGDEWEARHEDMAVSERLTEQAAAMGAFLEPAGFSLRGAASAWRSLAGQACSGLGHRHGRGAGAVSILGSLSLVAACAQPLMPSFASRLWTAIGSVGDIRTHRWGHPARRFVRPQTGPPGPLFAPIDAGRLDDVTREPVAAP